MTRAPSLARSAASGLPTTSELPQGYCLAIAVLVIVEINSIPIYDSDSFSVGSVTVRKDFVVYAGELQAFHDSQRGTWDNGLDSAGRWLFDIGDIRRNRQGIRRSKQ